MTGTFLAGGCSSAPPPSPPPSAPASHPAGEPAADPAAVAARLSGDWQFAMERGGQTIEGWLHFGLTAGELVGSLTGPDANPREISKVELKGDKVSWEIASDARTEHYEATLKGSSMEGTLKVGPGKGQRQRGGGGGGEGSGHSGGGGGGRHGGGGGGRGGGGGGRSSGSLTWKAYRSVQETPAASPTPAPRAGQ